MRTGSISTHATSPVPILDSWGLFSERYRRQDIVLGIAMRLSRALIATSLHEGLGCDLFVWRASEHAFCHGKVFRGRQPFILVVSDARDDICIQTVFVIRTVAHLEIHALTYDPPQARLGYFLVHGCMMGNFTA